MNQVPARIQHQNTPDSLRTGTWSAATGQAPQAIDHFRQYLDEDPIAAEEDFDVIDYWMKRRVTQPQLAQFCLIIYQSETFDAEPYNAAANRDSALGVTASEISQYIVKPLRDVEDSRPKNVTMTTTTVRHT
ncbi:hypothetical protein E4U31_001137 [Claviceps sp. LM219 group G6]|nr:hypothetical protein E4U31_001137 [Claviceps sp. LM219 group G6]